VLYFCTGTRAGISAVKAPFVYFHCPLERIGPDVLELYGRLSRDLDGIQPSVDRHSHFYVLVLSSALLVPVSTLVLASSWVDVYVIDLYVSAKSH